MKREDYIKDICDFLGIDTPKIEYVEQSALQTDTMQAMYKEGIIKVYNMYMRIYS